MEKQEIKIASEKGCPHCWGSGVVELQPLYYVTCFHCGGWTKEEKEFAEASKVLAEDSPRLQKLKEAAKRDK